MDWRWSGYRGVDILLILTSLTEYAISDIPCRPNIVTLVKSSPEESGIQLAGAGHKGHFYVKSLIKGIPTDIHILLLYK